MKKQVYLTGIFALLLLSAASINAQLPTLGSRQQYKMIFLFNNGTGIQDTIVSKVSYSVWQKSGNYPAYMKWKNLPFAVKTTGAGETGLFTDSTSSFSNGQAVGYVFYKVQSSGGFSTAYKETNLKGFIRNSDTPNLSIVVTSQGLELRAIGSITANTELTVRYSDLAGLFPGDVSAEKW